MNEVPATFYDADYYEHGQVTGKGWYENYRWMPRRSFREALAIIDALQLTDDIRLLDFGCAKGFLVRAMRELEMRADGCDISTYALGFAPPGCWNCSIEANWRKARKTGYTHIFCKDVFEHMTSKQLHDNLLSITTFKPELMLAIVPLAKNGIYIIPEYHYDSTHILKSDIKWWNNAFAIAGWKVKSFTYRINGLKDNWAHYPKGNGFYVLSLD